MPIDDTLKRRFHFVDGINSYAEAMGDPELLHRLDQFSEEGVPYNAPETECTEQLLSGPTGTFRIRIYTPLSLPASPRAALVWAHGGGFVGGDLDMPEGDLVSRELCSRADVVVVSVDYHLANGTASYPTLHEQVMSAFRWATGNGSSLGVNRDRIFLGGASAGGNLAVAATLELRDRAEALPAGLVLAYPFLHRQLDVGPELEKLLTEVPPLFRFTQTAVDSMYGAYLNGMAEAPYLSLDGNHLTDFPPSLVILSEYDDLRPSGESYADQATADGAKAETYLAPGMLHGHLNRLPAVPEVNSSLDRIVSFLGPNP
jgi:acetyl esterase